jgi:hypothetical protein
MKKIILCCGIFTLAALLVWAAEPLKLVRQSGQLKLRAPELQFVAKRAAQRLKNGITIRYSTKVTAIDQDRNRAESSQSDSISISYDLWEERYVAALDSRKDLKQRSKSLPDLERWTVEQLVVPSMSETKRYRVRLELALQEKPAETTVTPESGILQIVDIFSRRSNTEDTRWQMDSAVLRPADIR